MSDAVGEEEEEEAWEEEEEAGEWEEGYEGWEEEEEGGDAVEDDEEDDEEEESIDSEERERREIEKLENDGWTNASKVKAPPSRAPPKTPQAQAKDAKEKKETWDRVKSDRNWSEGVDLEAREQVSAPEVVEDVVAPVPEAVSALYEVDDALLGKGSFSQVRAAKHRESGQSVVLKLVTKETSRGLPLEGVATHQLDILGELKEVPNVSTVVEHFELEDGGVALILERRGTELLRALAAHPGPYTEAVAVSLIKRVLHTVASLHERGIAHMDIVAENFLLESEDLESPLSLEGFTLSRRADSSKLAVLGGCVQYQAPEVVFNTGFDVSADVWSAGVLAFLLLTGHLPFPETHPVRLKVQIKRAEPVWPEGVSGRAKEFLSLFFKEDPAERTTIQQALEHSLITGGGSGKVVPGFKQSISQLIPRD